MTKSDFGTNYGRISMPTPFAGGSGATITEILKTSGSSVNFRDGFPSAYSAPHSGGGKYVTRGEMNAVGNLASKNDFYEMCGGVNTFDPTFASDIGGYPEGAILDYVEGLKFFKVISLQDNNTFNFIEEGVDGIHWDLMNQSNAEADNDVIIARVSFGDKHTRLASVDTPMFEYFDTITAVRAPFSGILSLDEVNFVATKQEESVSFTGSYPVKIIHGNGVMFKDLGTNISSLKNISTPTAESANGWIQFGGAGTVTGRGEYITAQNTVVQKWVSQSSFPYIEQDHFVGIGILYALYRATARNTSATMTGFDIAAGSFNIKIRK